MADGGSSVGRDVSCMGVPCVVCVWLGRCGIECRTTEARRASPHFSWVRDSRMEARMEEGRKG